MSVIIENPETGDLRTLEPDQSGRYPIFYLPWRVKNTVRNITNQAAAVEYWANYKFKFCSACGQIGVFEAKG